MASDDPSGGPYLVSNDEAIGGDFTQANMAFSDRSFTVRAVAAGLLIGILINLSNTYYGLQAGSSSQMAMVSTLLGYGGFRAFQKCLKTPLSAAENVLITNVATATGCMPVTAGFTGTIPAPEYVIGSAENGPIRLSSTKLVVWSIGLCFFGLIFASLLRESLIVREKLPWPGPTATSFLIKPLHGRPNKDLAASFGSHERSMTRTATNEVIPLNLRGRTQIEG
jgi:uncharacterized oligopeptide transporter (OPT) family protein